MANINAVAIITAAGLGKRFSAEGANKLPKQFIPLLGKPLIVHSTQCFESSELIKEIILVVPDGWVDYAKSHIVEKFKLSKVSKVIAGGSERQQSVEKGIHSISSKPAVIAVHDGVRPFVTLDLIEEVIIEAGKSGGAIAAFPSTDTIKKSSPEHFIENTVPRDNIWFAQTPQAFRYEVLKQAFEKASQDGYLATDESQLVERLGMEVKLVRSSKHNIKITTPEDFEMGELILRTGLHNKKQG
jgi:2-C-methyl-D-erythritol 4-phosphate cytidylyltransferase